MRKLLSLMAMTLFAIAGWAQKAPETPIYFQIPASPYVVDLTEVNCKVGNTQTWICSENNTWNTVAPGTTGWHGKWTNMDTAEPVFVPYDDPNWATDQVPYGFEGQAVRDNGSSLFLYVRNITSVTGFFVDNNGGRTVSIKVYDKEGNLVKENSVKGTGSKGNIVTIDGLDDSVTGYKVEFTTNNKSCWIQAVKLEGTAKERYIPNFYLEQDANVIKAVGLAEGEALRYKKFINEDIPSGTTISGDDEEFPSKGLSFTPGEVLKLRVRAFNQNGDGSSTWTHTYELPVPVITDDYVAVKSIAKLDINEETGEWATSIPYNAWSQAYDNLDKVQWTTTATDYQYIYKVVPGYEKVTTLNGEEVEIPVVAMNRKNTMYYITEAPSIVKVTTAPVYKNAAAEKSGTVNTGTEVQFDNNKYNLYEDGTMTINVEPGVHVFNYWNKPDVGFQMLEIKKGYDAMADAMLDMAKLEAMQADLTQFIAGKDEYIDPDVNASIATFMGDTYQIMIGEALEEAQANGTKYVSPIDWDNLAAIVAEIKAQITANIPVDIKLAPETGSDIAAALATAKEGIAKIGNITIELAEAGAYTVNATLEAPNNITINGNGATIDASALAAPFVTLNGTAKAATQIDAVAEDGTLTTSESTSFKYIENVNINGVTITGLAKALVRDEQKTLVENVLVDNSNIEIVGNSSIIDFNSKGYPAVLKVSNSTLWSKEGHGGFFAQLQNRLADIDKTKKNVYTETIAIENSTLYNISVGKKMNNLSQKGQTWLTFSLTNSIFYNVSTADPINGWNGGQDSPNPTMVYENNTYWSNDGAVAVWTDESKNTSDKTGTALTTDPSFADAANGDFTVGKSTEQARLETGDPRWLVPYVEPAVAITEPREWDFTTGAAYAEALKADTNNWGVLSKGRYQNLNELTDAELVVGENALEMTAGLRFTAAAKNILVGTESGNLYIQYTGGNVTMTIPNCKAGYKVSVDWSSSGKDKEAKLTFENTLEPEATTTSTSKINNIVTVAEDGDVIITGNANTRLYALLVASEETVGINNAIVSTTVNGPVYNLAGQKVDANFKGIVIMNGKKVMVK